MGLEGIAIAAGVLLLVAIVAPAFYRGRAVVASAPADERFAPDLRMIENRGYAYTEHSDFRCTIYPLERGMMKTTTAPTKVRKPNDHGSRVRTLARARSRARAGIAARRAMRSRFAVVAALLAGVTIVLWVLVASINLSLIAAIGMTLILAVYVAGFIYLLTVWHTADVEDRRTIEHAKTVMQELREGRTALSAHARTQKAHTGHIHANNRMPGRQVSVSNRSGYVGAQEPMQVTEATAATSQADASAVTSAENHGSQQGDMRSTRAKSAQKHQQEAKNAAKNQPASRSASRPTGQLAKQTNKQPNIQKIIVPSYTLKPSGSSQHVPSKGPVVIERRNVQAYVAPPAAEAPVPYRPMHLGERIGDVEPEAPNAVPSTIADAPICERKDVLGVGEALDSLLERRRA